MTAMSSPEEKTEGCISCDGLHCERRNWCRVSTIRTCLHLGRAVVQEAAGGHSGGRAESCGDAVQV